MNINEVGGLLRTAGAETTINLENLYIQRGKGVGWGGAMSFLSGSQANLKDVVFEECQSGNGGGVAILGNSVANFQGVHFLNNKAIGAAGAVFVSSSLAIFEDTVFEKNEVSFACFYLKFLIYMQKYIQFIHIPYAVSYLPHYQPAHPFNVLYEVFSKHLQDSLLFCSYFQNQRCISEAPWIHLCQAIQTRSIL